MTNPPYVAQSDEHQMLQWLGDSTVEVLLDAEKTSGDLAVLRAQQAARDAAPWHVHGREDETMVLLDGEAVVWIGDGRYQLGPSGVAFMPRDVPHAYVIESETADVVFLITPAGLEGFFRQAGHDLDTPLPEGWSLTPQVLGAAFAEHGGTILGPPPQVDD